MKYSHQPKDHRDRVTPMPDLQPSLSSPRWGMSNRGMQVDETGARWKLARQGYRIHSGGLYFIVNDDPEDFREALVANWDGSAVEAFNHLEAHGFPTSPFILCQTCQSGEAEFGGLCEPCSREVVSWVRAGEYL